MKPVQFPRPLLLSLILMVMAALLFGIIRAFPVARAASGPTATPASVSWTETPAADEAEEESETETLTPFLMSQAHATDGIMALAIILMVVILVGVIWGERTRLKRGRPKKD